MNKRKPFSSDESKRVIDYYLNNPEMTLREIAEKVDRKVSSIDSHIYAKVKPYRRNLIKTKGWLNRDGYKYIRLEEGHKFQCMVPNNSHHQKYNLILEHRVIMAEYLDRPLLSNEKVHHKDGNKANNSIDNLQLIISSGGHVGGQSYCCKDCGSIRLEPVKIERGNK